MKPKAIKARRVWTNDYGCYSEFPDTASEYGTYKIRQVSILDVSDPKALVEQAAISIWKKRIKYALPPMPIKTLQAMYRRQARAVLESLGILPKKRKAK